MSAAPVTSSRFAARISWPFLWWMVAFAAITAAGGVTYAVLKNQQVAVRTEIEMLNRSISESNMNTNENRAKINTLTNRWAMLARLDSFNSELSDIQPGQLEELRDVNTTERNMATAAR